MEELPFECDLTQAAQPGKNLLCIRITNPGGRLDWVDGSRITWGHVEFQKSHGFGGIDRAMMLSVHGDLRIADAWVLNTPQPKQITAHATLENKSSGAATGNLRFAVIDPVGQKVLVSVDMPVDLAAGQSTTISSSLSAPSTKLWDMDTPNNYLR
jgi:hypothetical protein